MVQMIERFLDDGLRQKMREPDVSTFMTVFIPGDIDPLERHHRFTVHLDAELRLADLGCSDGGGTLYFDGEDAGAEPGKCFCVIDIDATDVNAARALLRLHLPELGIPAGTMVQWDELEDRFDGLDWQLARPRSLGEFDL
jgi:hypothetical protein